MSKISLLWWKERGYFGAPEFPEPIRSTSNVEKDPWLAFTTAVQQVKLGNFTALPRLVDIYYKSGGPHTDHAWTTLTGDAAPSSHFIPIIQELEKPKDPEDYELAIDFSMALATRGRLADVPLLLNVYKRHVDIKDACIIPGGISNLLSREPDMVADGAMKDSIDEYIEMVMARYNELVKKLGTDQIFVYKGDQFGVIRLAHLIMENLSQPYAISMLVRRFEISTGIDCSKHSRNKALSPQMLRESIEEFLNGPSVNKYTDGVRYFFGHPIPD